MHPPPPPPAPVFSVHPLLQVACVSFVIPEVLIGFLVGDGLIACRLITKNQSPRNTAALELKQHAAAGEE